MRLLLTAIVFATALFVVSLGFASADESIVPAPVGAGIACARAVQAQYPYSVYDPYKDTVPFGKVKLISYRNAELRALLEARCYIAMIQIGLAEGWYQDSQPNLLRGDSRTDLQILQDFESWLANEIATPDSFYCILGVGGSTSPECVMVGSDRETKLREQGWIP